MDLDSTVRLEPVVAGILFVFGAMGLIAGGQEADEGLTATWLWMGIGLAVTYLLYRLVVAVEQLADAE